MVFGKRVGSQILRCLGARASSSSEGLRAWGVPRIWSDPAIPASFICERDTYKQIKANLQQKPAENLWDFLHSFFTENLPCSACCQDILPRMGFLRMSSSTAEFGEVFQEYPWAVSVVSPITVDKPVYVLNFTSTFLSTSFLIHFSDRADYMAFGTNDMEAHPWAADFSHHALPFP